MSARRAKVKTVRLTGERPSPVAMWYDRVAKGNCVAARRGGEQPDANNSAQNSMTMRLNSIRPGRIRRACGVKAKPVASAMPVASPKHINAMTIGNDGVLGVSGVGKSDWKSLETGAGARREPRRSQSPHSSKEAGNDRGAKGGRKVKA